ncbi:hypothetical protein Barb6_03056 [Bacteroidales bacterium Barb6]|nr:hypothetical protein Barb6_03056 [Bacteroidales bacterium Barb6]
MIIYFYVNNFLIYISLDVIILFLFFLYIFQIATCGAEILHSFGMCVISLNVFVLKSLPAFLFSFSRCFIWDNSYAFSGKYGKMYLISNA